MAKLSFEALVRELRGFHPEFSPQKVPTVVARQFIVRALNYVIGKAAGVRADTVSVSHVVERKTLMDALEDEDNRRNSIQVPPFTRIIDSIRIENRDPDDPEGAVGPGERVERVSLATQYPGRLMHRITFPSLAIRDYCLELTDMRKLRKPEGEEDEEKHGWEDYGNMEYDYVPYHITHSAVKESETEMPSVVEEPTLEVPSSMLAAVQLAAAIQLAKRAGLMNYAAMLDGQYRFEMDRIVAQANVSAGEP